MYSGPNLKLNESTLDKFLNQPSGEVGRYMRRVGVQILTGARGMVPVDTGRLRASLSMSHNRRGRFQYVQVGASAHYALIVHNGQRPHVIEPNQGRILRFSNRGRVVYARRVMHPGSRGKPYLTVPMRAAVRG